MTPPVLDSADWWGLFAHFLMLSLLAIGGAIGTAPEMHRYLVEQQHWMTDEQFSAAIAIAQAAPGPTCCSSPCWAGAWRASLGMCTTMLGILLPSTTLGARRRALGRGAPHDARRAGLRQRHGAADGRAGAVSGWILGMPSRHEWALLATIAVTTLVCVRTRIGPVWLIGAGAVVGAFVG
jgi:chromate transporter